VRGKVAGDLAALAAARSLEDAANARKQNGLATLPEVLQAQEEAARATYELQDALAGEHDARMALLESIGHPSRHADRDRRRLQEPLRPR